MKQNDAPDFKVDRRTTIRWLAATMLAAGSGCAASRRFVGEEIPPADPGGLLLGAARVPAGTGYGKDPDLADPAIPWPRTMTNRQLDACARLCDAVLPADERSPAASTLGVHEFIDEWVSAPYPQQQADRVLILEHLEWLERQCRERFGRRLADADPSDLEELLVPVSRPGPGDAQFERQAECFARFRYLAVGAFYTTREGIADIGYLGNVPIAGAYPGPSAEALEHLAGVLRQLGLPPPRLPGV